MSIPITIKFFREIELYQELNTLNNKFGKEKNDDWKVWNTEKAILSKYSEKTDLSTARTIEEIRKEVLGEGKNKTVPEMHEEYDIHLSVPMRNLIRRGFAQGNNERISLTAEGILMGTVINKSQSGFGVVRYKFLYWLTWVTIISGSLLIIFNLIEKILDLICK